MDTVSSLLPDHQVAYRTDKGAYHVGDGLSLLASLPTNSIDLIMTSPPFALLRKKAYGNKDQHDYVDWLTEFGAEALKKLKPTGSLVINIGGAYQQGVPVRSLYNFRIPIRFCDELGYHLAEDFYWYNPAKLPSPIEWVNKRKIRVKDAVNTVWWFSKTEFPKADVRNVLAPYSDRMKKLIKTRQNFMMPKRDPLVMTLAIISGATMAELYRPTYSRFQTQNPTHTIWLFVKNWRLRVIRHVFRPNYPNFSSITSPSRAMSYSIYLPDRIQLAK